ncbi:BTAD domain-containing putative transcriptional regulator [Kutzneria buriramensis]|uniref:DNA-binding SARP family transcriptional activator n=1 Tax=Kutzneria buriramensis TaxID=1045776 RepID=A0A3E0HZU7_9PSEU|nr:BTAD domain-containing putative transcriptional regulator [Kutzneria buriramensis]REH51992.1 DNA-binding SARP family transcriptional activator [Kutzneria buriramensis]
MELRLLGPVQARIGDATVDLGPRQRRLVLAVLAMEVNRLVPVDRLVELVWPVRAPRTAAHAVRVSVSSIRALLSEAQVDPDELTVVTRGSGYQLRADPMLIDVHRFQALVARSRDGADDPSRLALLDEALALWRGPALVDTADPEIVDELVGGVTETRLTAQEDRFDILLRLGRHQEALSELPTLVDLHPTRERLVGQLMLALHRGGQTSRALAVSRRTRALLAEELGIDPSEDLSRLELAILRNDPTLTASRAQPRVELTAPALLPPAIGDFTGREDQFAALDEAGAVKLVVGTAGVGKTALAVQWAHRVRAKFPDGQLYVNLNGYSVGPPVQPLQALSQFLRAVGVQPDRVPVDLAEATGMYRSLLADRKMVVLLDNAVSGEQVRPLLPAGPGCQVVITSRSRLDGLVAMDGAQRLALDVLSPDEAISLLRNMIGGERVDADPAAAASLAATCAHLPLALRITGAQLASHPWRQIADHVAALDQGDVLASLRIDDDEHSAVRAAFDLSYSGLKPDAQELFRRLGLVPGPDVSAESAAVLIEATPHDAAALLDRLAAAHLVDQPEPGRYTCHDLLRHYARERSGEQDSAEERESVLCRLLEHYLRHARAAVGVLYPHVLQLVSPTEKLFDDFASALAWLDAERAGMVAAVHHAARAGLREQAWLLADAIRGYLYARGEIADWFATARLALTLSAENPRAKAAALFSLGTAHYAVNQYAEAIELCTSALELCKETGWLYGQACVRNNLGLISESTGELAQAAAHYEQALRIGLRLGNRFTEEMALVNLGMVCQARGESERSVDFYRRALTVQREINPRGEGTVLVYLGAALCLHGDLDEALASCVAGLAGSREIGARNDEAHSQVTIAKIQHAAGRRDEALAAARAAIEIGADIADLRTEACAWTVLGAILGGTVECERAVALARSIGARYDECEALITMAVNLVPVGGLEQATLYAQHAVSIARDVGYGALEGRALSVLADIALRGTHSWRAVDLATEALSVQRRCGDRLGVAATLCVLGIALRASVGPGAAPPHWREARDLYARCHAPEPPRLKALLGA